MFLFLPTFVHPVKTLKATQGRELQNEDVGGERQEVQVMEICRIAVDAQLEEAKTVLAREATSWEFVPQCNSSGEEAA